MAKAFQAKTAKSQNGNAASQLCFLAAPAPLTVPLAGDFWDWAQTVGNPRRSYDGIAPLELELRPHDDCVAAGNKQTKG